MKPQDWNEGLNHLDQDLVEEYIELKDKKRKPKRPFWMATVAAALVVTIGLGMLAGNGILPSNPPSLETLPATEPSIPTTAAPTQPVATNPATIAPTQPVVTNPATIAPTQPVATNPATIAPTRPVVTNPPTTPPQEPVIVPLNNLVYEPAYPEMPQYPSDKELNLGSMEYYRAVREWEANRKMFYQQPAGYADSLTDFFHSSIQQFLQGDDNQVYSPLNVYLAMAMLAETTDGDSRQQLLDLFGLDSIEQLREQVNHLWNAHYCEDGKTTTLLANSLWLDDAYTFKQKAAQILADSYYASSFSGDLGTDAMNKQLQSWVNENTGGRLAEQANNIELDDETVFALASTVYFKAGWTSEFLPKFTKNALFHSVNADIKVPFMNKTMVNYLYYWGENFGAIRLALTGDNYMWLILPDEGYTVADILESDEYLQMTLNPQTWKNKKAYEVNLSMPKFDVAEQQDLIDGMKAMGLTDIFDYWRADFSPLTDTSNLYVGMIDHAARVSVDETGCEGTAFTIISVPMGTAPQKHDKIDFILDRPFMFLVSSQDDLPLFAGVVNEP